MDNISHNCVDTLVKNIIVRHFTAFPTRMHVLSHALLCNGNGMEWVQKEDGLFYIESLFPQEPHEGGIEMHEMEGGIFESMGFDAGRSFDNMIAAWVNDNIDRYVTKQFHFHSIDLRPNAHYEISPNYNLLDKMPNIDLIAPEWKGAIEEVCEYFMRKLTPTSFIFNSKEALEYLRHTDKVAATSYLILMRAYDKVKPAPNEKLNKLAEKLLKTPTLEQRYEEFNLEGVISFDEFKSVKKLHEKDCYESFSSFVKSYLTTRERYFPNGIDAPANEQFSIDVMKALESDAGWRFFGVPDFAYSVQRRLNIPSMFDQRVRTEIEGCIGLAVSAG